MQRRTFIALAATVPFAGCLGGGSDGVSAEITAAGDMEDTLSPSFSASEGDEYEVTVIAGPDGAAVSLMPEEGEGGLGPDDTEAEDIGWGWHLDPDEEINETVEIREDEDHVFWITQGEAEVEAEPA